MWRWCSYLFLCCCGSVALADIDPLPPKLAATAYILVDFNSGQVIHELNSEKRVEPASLTKMMTTYVVHKQIEGGRIKPTDLASVSEKAWRMGGSRMFLDVGTQVTVEELLKGIIIQSGNDATVALAEHVAGSESNFTTLMNQYSKQLGLHDTNFVNVTGLPHADHYSTAKDLAALVRAIIRDYPDEYTLYSEKQFTFNGITQQNRNKLLWQDQYVDGVKTGHTETAGFCLAASAVRDNMRLIAVVLGTRNENARATETQKLLTYGFRFYETHKLYSAREALARPRVWKGDLDQMPVGLSHDLYVTIPKGRYPLLKATMSLDARIVAPVRKDSSYGSVNITFDNQPFLQRDLIALESVAESGLFGSLVDQVKMVFE